MRSMSLSTKLVFVGILIVLVPALAIGSFCVVKSGSTLESTLERQLSGTAKNLADMVELSLLQEMDMVKELSIGLTTRDVASKVARDGLDASAADVKRLEGKLASALNDVGKNYENIAVTDRSGVVYVDAMDSKTRGIKLGDRGYIKKALGGEVVVGDVVKSKASGNLILPIAAPVHNAQKEVVGVLFVALKIDFLVDKVITTKVGKSGVAVIMDATGMTIAHPNKDLVMKVDITKTPGMEDVAKAMLSGAFGVQRYVINGVHKLGGYAPIPVTHWCVMAAVESNDILSPIYEMRNRIFVIGGVFLVLVAVMVFFLGRKLSIPITQAALGLSSASERIKSASSVVAELSEQLAEGTSEQAAAVEETSSSLEEIASMTKQNAESATGANLLMQDANKAVREANDSMTGLTASMGEISSASQEIQKIIKTIDEIAFQTNLLALNAAVEAARAGEAGAGFAVVADEVRNLAMRAAEAAKSTAGLIEGAVKKVKEGSDLVDRTSKAFDGVSESVRKSGELVAEIAEASREQSQGISQVSSAVGEIDKVVQRNSSSAEESAASSKEMSALALRMSDYVSRLMELVGGDKQPARQEREIRDIVEARRDALSSPGGRVAATGAGASGRKALPHYKKKSEGGFGTTLSLSDDSNDFNDF